MFFFVSALLALLVPCSLGSALWETHQCVPFSSNVCASLNYTYAYLRRDIDLDTPEEKLEGYKLLIESKCHPSLLDFLCLTYYPFCHPAVDIVVRPCRSLCLDVRKHCLGLIEAAGFQWPKELNCSNYPEAGQCFPGKKVEDTCLPCNLVQQKHALRAACSKEKSLYARVRILEELVFHGKIAYKAQLLSLYRPRLFRGGEADKETKEVTIITNSTSDCPCAKMTLGVQYFIGGVYYGLGYKSLYILPNDGIIKRWNIGGSFGRKINRCLITVDE